MVVLCVEYVIFDSTFREEEEGEGGRGGECIQYSYFHISFFYFVSHEFKRETREFGYLLKLFKNCEYYFDAILDII